MNAPVARREFAAAAASKRLWVFVVGHGKTCVIGASEHPKRDAYNAACRVRAAPVRMMILDGEYDGERVLAALHSHFADHLLYGQHYMRDVDQAMAATFTLTDARWRSMDHWGAPPGR